MAILVTGGTGLLGSNLAHHLCGRGLMPRLLVRSHSNERGLEGLNARRLTGDLLDAHSLERALEGVEQVYHCAGMVRFDAASRGLLQQANVEGTRNLLAAAKRMGVRRVVHVSSVSTVGRGPLSEPATEDSAAEVDADEPYPASKLAAEAIARAAADGLEVVIANPTIVVGAYDVKPTSGELLLAVAHGLGRFYPTGGTNFVNAQDVARGLELLMERGQSGERYILGGENLTYRAFLALCAEEAGVSGPSVPIPEGPLRALARGGDAIARIAPRHLRWFNSPLARAMSRAAYASSQKAERALGYRPRPVRLGVRAAYAWFQENGYLPADRPLTPHRRVPGWT